MPDHIATLEDLLAAWPQDQAPLRQALLELMDHAGSRPGAVLEMVSRPGVSHSLRFDLRPRPPGRERPVFFLVDVVLAADELFLSVCFYEDEISDPRELGNAIPQGLFEETGYCFDLDRPDDEFMAYLLERIDQAHARARGEGG